MAIKLFCKHIYKVTGNELLEEGTLRDFEDCRVGTYEKYAITRECVKCGKKKLTEERINNRMTTWEILDWYKENRTGR